MYLAYIIIQTTVLRKDIIFKLLDYSIFLLK